MVVFSHEAVMERLFFQYMIWRVVGPKRDCQMVDPVNRISSRF